MDQWRFALTLSGGNGLSGIGFYRQLVRDKKTVIVLASPPKLRQLRVALENEMFNVLVTTPSVATSLHLGEDHSTGIVMR